MRYIEKSVLKDLKKKMVFIGGPHQVGKTTLSKTILNNYKGRYLNWDYDDDRQDILHKKWDESDKLLVLDELHKFPKWKRWIKGIYDVNNEIHNFLITGSARMDVYKKGGDSLLGRYHYWRLHPFTLNEIPKGISKINAFKRLMSVGGFPEPFLDGDERSARRWRRERFDRIIREDIRDLESIRNIQSIGLLIDLLRERVGGLIRISNLANDLEVSSKTIKHWIEILEKMYLIFIVKPYVKSLPRAILKPPKIYFFDNADILGEEGVKFKNLIATTLLKKIHFLEDLEGYRYELRFLRDKEGREVDFVILKEGQIEEIIEVKYSDENISKSLIYYAERLNPPKVTQIVANLKRNYNKNLLKVTDPISYFSKPLKMK